MTITTFAAFALMCLLNAVVPGPNLLLVLRARASGGPAAARATIAGIASAQTLWGALAIAGAAVVFEQAPLLFVAMKLVGALYIGTMGLRLLVGDARRRSARNAGTFEAGRVRFAVEGLTTCLLNPNVLLFYLAVFPQFMAGADPTTGIATVLVASAVLVNASWFVGVVHVLERRGRHAAGFGPWVNRGLGVGMVGFGALLIARV